MQITQYFLVHKVKAKLLTRTGWSPFSVIVWFRFFHGLNKTKLNTMTSFRFTRLEIGKNFVYAYLVYEYNGFLFHLPFFLCINDHKKTKQRMINEFIVAAPAPWETSGLKLNNNK